MICDKSCCLKIVCNIFDHYVIKFQLGLDIEKSILESLLGHFNRSFYYKKKTPES